MDCRQIVIDLLRLRDLNTGLGQLCLAYGKALSTMTNPDFRFTFLVPRHFIGYFGQNVRYLCPSPIQYCFPRLLRKRCDLWHSVHQDIHYSPVKGAVWVFTIHDLNFLYEKSAVKIAKRKHRLNRLLQKVTQTVVISFFTQREIEKHLTLHSPVQVIYNGAHIASSHTGDCPAFAGTEKFFLAIGVFKPNKNYESLVELMLARPAERLIIAGSYHTAYGQYILNMIRQKGLQDRIITPGKVNESEKIWLYGHCEALLFPSTNEGMGSPVLEAMRFGKPVIISNMSCMPEFGGNYAYYFHSFAPEDMWKTIEESLAHFHQHPERATEMQHYSEQFSWEKCAEQYIQLFERLLSSKP